VSSSASPQMARTRASQWSEGTTTSCNAALRVSGVAGPARKAAARLQVDAEHAAASSLGAQRATRHLQEPHVSAQPNTRHGYTPAARPPDCTPGPERARPAG
jgi:hypothetical protein